MGHIDRRTDRPVDFYEAMHAIGRFVRARRRLARTVRQERFLRERGEWREGMSRGEAFGAIRRIVAGPGASA